MENRTTMDPKNIALLSMEEEMVTVEKVTDESNSRKDKALRILDPIIERIEFKEGDERDPKITASLLSILDRYVSISESKESTAFKRVNAKARMSEARTNEQQAEATVALIKAQCERVDNATIVLDAPPDKIELEIPDEIMNTISKDELRDNPDDLT